MRWQIEDSPARAAFRDEFRGWLREVLPAAWVDAVEADDDQRLASARVGFDVERWQRTIGASGYGAPLWPTEYGGLSGESWTQQIVREELARHRLPTLSYNLLGIGLAGPTIIEHGTEEQKRRYLPKILTA